MLLSFLLRDADDYFCLQQQVTPQESHQQELQRPPSTPRATFTHTVASLLAVKHKPNQPDKACTFLPVSLVQTTDCPLWAQGINALSSIPRIVRAFRCCYPPAFSWCKCVFCQLCWPVRATEHGIYIYTYITREQGTAAMCTVYDLKFCYRQAPHILQVWNVVVYGLSLQSSLPSSLQHLLCHPPQKPLPCSYTASVCNTGKLKAQTSLTRNLSKGTQVITGQSALLILVRNIKKNFSNVSYKRETGFWSSLRRSTKLSLGGDAPEKGSEQDS